MKQMKYRLSIADGDFRTKTAQVEKFLVKGHQVKLTVMFRGREVSRPEPGEALLARVCDAVCDIAKPQGTPRFASPNMTVVLQPNSRKRS